jgi:hypothetical protein
MVMMTARRIAACCGGALVTSWVLADGGVPLIGLTFAMVPWAVVVALIVDRGDRP